MAGWLRLETRMAFIGWTSELPAAQYAAWVKLLQVVKEFGRNGEIADRYFTETQLRRLNIDPEDWRQMLVTAVTVGNAASISGGIITLLSWSQLNDDPTNSDRQRRFKQKNKAVTVVTEGNGNNDDGTGRDVTGQDGTGRDKRRAADPADPVKDQTEKSQDGADAIAQFDQALSDRGLRSGCWGARDAELVNNLIAGFGLSQVLKTIRDPARRFADLYGLKKILDGDENARLNGQRYPPKGDTANTDELKRAALAGAEKIYGPEEDKA